MAIASDVVDLIVDKAFIVMRDKQLDGFVNNYSLGYSFDQMKIDLRFGTLLPDKRVHETHLS